MKYQELNEPMKKHEVRNAIFEVKVQLRKSLYLLNERVDKLESMLKQNLKQNQLTEDKGKEEVVEKERDVLLLGEDGEEVENRGETVV